MAVQTHSLKLTMLCGGCSCTFGIKFLLGDPFEAGDRIRQVGPRRAFHPLFVLWEQFRWTWTAMLPQNEPTDLNRRPPGFKKRPWTFRRCPFEGKGVPGVSFSFDVWAEGGRPGAPGDKRRQRLPPEESELARWLRPCVFFSPFLGLPALWSPKVSFVLAYFESRSQKHDWFSTSLHRLKVWVCLQIGVPLQKQAQDVSFWFPLSRPKGIPSKKIPKSCPSLVVGVWFALCQRGTKSAKVLGSEGL